MSIVIDSGILITALFPDEPLAPQASALMHYHSAETISAPRLLKSEVIAVIRKAVYTQRISSVTGEELLQSAFATPLEFYESDALLIDAYHIATELNQPRTYDSQYLALARRLDVTLWTADKRLFNSANSRFQVRWLGELSEG